MYEFSCVSFGFLSREIFCDDLHICYLEAWFEFYFLVILCEFSCVSLSFLSRVIFFGGVHLLFGCLRLYWMVWFIPYFSFSGVFWGVGLRGSGGAWLAGGEPVSGG